MKNFQLLYGVICHNYNIQTKSHVLELSKFSFVWERLCIVTM